MPYQNAENRQCLKIGKFVEYKKIVFPSKIIPSKVKRAFSGELSNNGIAFLTKHLPELSAIVCIHIEHKDIPFHKDIREQILMLGNEPIGKVVQIEDLGGGFYNVGVLFFRKSVILGRYLQYFAIHTRIHRFAAYSLRVLFILLIVFTTLSINIIRLERSEIYRPNRRVYIIPQDIGILYEDVSFNTEDGQEINGWFIPESEAKATILFCNGRSGNMCDQLARIKFFHNMGVNLMMFDYRGYGKNSGKPSEKGLYKDALAAYDYLISREGIDKNRIIVFGESLGASVAAELCLKRKTQALVLESPLVSLAIEKKILYPFLPTGFLLFEKFDTLSKIKNIHIPKLIVHGMDDEMIPFAEVLHLYYVAPSPKQFLPFSGAHNDDIFKISDTYRDELNKFFLNNKIVLR